MPILYFAVTSVKIFCLYADPSEVSKLQCVHSKAGGFLVKNWNEIWKIELEDTDTAFAVFCNKEVKHFTFKNQSKLETFLAGIQVDGKILLLQTVTRRQRVPFSPFCSKCTRQSCVHWLNYKKLVEEGDTFVFNHLINDDAVDVIGDDLRADVSEHGQEVAEESEGDAEGDAETETLKDLHWKTMPPREIYHELYGYNETDIPYPFQSDKFLQAGFLQRMQGIYDFPAQFIPVWSPSYQCKHENLFDPDDSKLGRHSKNIVVYSNIGERIFDVEAMFRKTLGNCRCLQQYDGHPQLLWHIGFGRFVDYSLLHLHLHRMRADGMGTYPEYKSIAESLASIGISGTLTYKDLHRAVLGFFRRLKFDERTAFSCPDHGVTPRFLNTDGKNMGPTKRKVKHLSELEKHPDDDDVLPQSTFFHKRVFLPKIKERHLVVELLAGDISKDEFCNSEDLESQNGRLVVDLVRVLVNDEEIPTQYRRFIKNICKPTSVRGLIQVTSSEPLLYLKQYCQGDINIKSFDQRSKLQVVMKQLPALWPILENICNLERSSALPNEVSAIVLKLLEIREQTFTDASPREANMYYAYEEIEEPKTSYYPNNPTLKHPKQYTVNKVKDKDLCEKAFIGHSDFAAGIFTAGCACKYNITLGWELMLSNESPRNLFRLLMCNQFDLKKMTGVLMDHACKFDTYMLNREAKELEHLLILVDGSHWNAQKKLKYPNSKGKGGHLGCSEGYNWNLYKSSYGNDEAINSQGREQMHSILENLSKSMRLMNYQHFMLVLYVFFATTNIHNRDYK